MNTTETIINNLNSPFNLNSLSDEQLNHLMFEHNPLYIVSNYSASKKIDFENILKTRNFKNAITKEIINQSQSHYDDIKDNFDFIFNFHPDKYKYINESFDDNRQRTKKQIDDLFTQATQEINKSIQNIKINLLLLPVVQKNLRKRIPQVQDLAQKSFDLITKLQDISEHCYKKVSFDLSDKSEYQEIVHTLLNPPVSFSRLGIDEFFVVAAHADEHREQFGLVARDKPYENSWRRHSDVINSFEQILSYENLIQKHYCIFNIYFDLLLTMGMKLGSSRIQMERFPTFERVYNHSISQINYSFLRKSIYDSVQEHERKKNDALNEYKNRRVEKQILFDKNLRNWEANIGVFPRLVHEIMDFLSSPTKKINNKNKKVISWDENKEYVYIDFSERNKSMIFLVQKNQRIGYPKTLTGFLLSNDYFEKMKSQGDFVNTLENLHKNQDEELRKFPYTNFISLDSMHLEMTNFNIQKIIFKDIDKPYEFISEVYA